MEFAGKTLDDKSVEYGSTLANRLMDSELLPPEQMQVEADQIRVEMDSTITDNLDAAASFVLTAAQACESERHKRNVYDFGRVATSVAVQIIANDPELGKRLLHNMLTLSNSDFVDGAWAETTTQYESGKLDYDVFNKFYLIRHMS